MTRFAWLQVRTQTLVVAAALAVVAVVAAVTGVQLSHLFHGLVAHCRLGCDLATREFLSRDTVLQRAFDLVAQVVPAVLGVFWGAPLVARELESGTYRLAWTQSVSRSRWLLTKLAVGGLATLVVSGVLTLTVTWWYRAFDKVGSNQFALFDRRDLAPIGYAAFAFAMGVLLGALLRRVVPTMAATLGVYVVARVATTLWVRPSLLPARHASTSLLDAGQLGFESSNGSPLTLVAHADAPPGSWTLSSRLVTSSGQAPGRSQVAAFLKAHCPAVVQAPMEPPPGHSVVRRVADPAVFQACQDQLARTYHLVVTYQPAGRYWTLQWLELGLFVLLALAAASTSWWWVARRSR